jgi:hypothetical protein
MTFLATKGSMKSQIHLGKIILSLTQKISCQDGFLVSCFALLLKIPQKWPLQYKFA